MGFLLILCGTIAALTGLYRGFVLAREALAPLAHDGDPTRTAIEATRPFPVRPRFRRFVSRVIGAIGWLAVAMYGLYLISWAAGLPPG
jgi:hypothetical protein